MTDHLAAGAVSPLAPDDLSRQKGPGGARRQQLGVALAAEFLGTFILVFFGAGAVNAAVATGAQTGLWQVEATARSLDGAHKLVARQVVQNLGDKRSGHALSPCEILRSYQPSLAFLCQPCERAQRTTTGM